MVVGYDAYEGHVRVQLLKELADIRWPVTPDPQIHLDAHVSELTLHRFADLLV